MHMLEYILFAVVRSLVLLLPLGAAQRSGRLLGRAASRILTRRRSIAMENLLSAFPGMDERERASITRGAFENFGIAMLELLWFPRMTDEILRGLIRLPAGEETLAPVRAAGPLVILSGHMGNWELSAFGIARLAGRPLTIVVRTQSNRGIDVAVNSLRTRLGNSVVSMEKSVREVIKTLSAGGGVAMLADQSAARESEYVPFFGRNVATYRGPALLALRTNAAVSMGFLTRRPDYTYEFEVLPVPTADLREATDENVAELTRRHTALLESRIRLHPEQWLWTHRRWKHVR